MSETSVAAFVAADAQQSLAQSFLSNELLYGKDREAGLIAVHQISDTQVRLYKRENGQLTYRDEPFYPFFFISNPGLLSGYKS
ncbi:MAG: hypothetical protein RML35_03085 [Chloroherpetonaceae bacterium]|nr:hypothetical protein [Chloroherpetonaceae bacterium]